ncbi:MAG: 2-phosphosulfolactate phosphatase [bacterium]|nr:2-phosphosulfolactate phosphatase [bacterium]
MILDLHFTPPREEDAVGSGTNLRDGAVVLIDVLRSTTSICHAMAAGCQRIIPVADLGEATQRIETLGRASLLLGGERDSRRIAGFDLGNSPGEYDDPRLRGANLVMLTSNGTAALARLRHLRAVAVAAFVNLERAARWLAGGGGRATIVCAGHHGRFCLEDAVCAGLLVQRIQDLRRGEPMQLSDAARVGLVLAAQWGGDLPACLAEAAHGRALAEAGFAADLELCARRDAFDILPIQAGEQITLRDPTAPAGPTGGGTGRKRREST